MKLTNEFTVSADPEKVWQTLLDMEAVATCLPGATIEASDEDDVYKGGMRMKIGPMTVNYTGTAKFAEIDNEARRAVIDLKARETKGQGTATATITNTVESIDGGSRVVAETELQVTGPQARFGRGVMEDVANRILAEFAKRLEEKIVAPPESEASSGGGTSAAGQAPRPEDDVLDVGNVLSQTALFRTARVVAPIAAALVVLWVILRGRRS